MPTLTTLRAASPLNASDDSRLIFTQDVTEVLTRDLDNVDADFGTMDAGLTWTVEESENATGNDDSYTLQIRIRNAAGTVVLAGANLTNDDTSWQTVIAHTGANSLHTTDTNRGPTAFTSVNTTANKTTWDGALVELRQVYSRNMGKDGRSFRVDTIAINGNYTVASTPNTGSASGSISWVGSAAGTATHAGAATGAVSWVGAATGATDHEGAASGSVSWVGAADGAADYQGSATGAVDWVGSATGVAPTGVSEGSASGSISWAGAATGTAAYEGDATGSVTWSGAADGVADLEGSATGTVTWAGSATGATVHEGSATGTVDWAGAADGTTTREGAVTGTITWAGSAQGEAPTEGVNDGSAAGTISWVGSATGQADHEGSAAGAIGWAGTADGVTDYAGAASGSITWSGSATGTQPVETFWAPDPVGYSPYSALGAGAPGAFTPVGPNDPPL